MDTDAEGRNKLRDLLSSTSLSAASVVASILGLVVFLSLTGSEPDVADPPPSSVPETTEETTVTTLFVVPTITTPSASEEASLPISWTQAGGPGVGGRVTALTISPDDSMLILAAGDLLGVARSVDGGVSWQSTTGFTNWEIGDVVFDPSDPSRVWAGTMGGPFLSHDSGSTWQARRDGMPAVDDSSYTAPIETILFDPIVDGRLIAVGGSQRRWRASNGSPLFGTIWESLDDGRTWSELGAIPNQANIQAAIFLSESSTDLLAGVADGGVYRSEDGGKSWVASNSGLPHGNATDIVAHPSDSQRAWLTLGAGPKVGEHHLPGGVFMTTDGGRSWQPMLEGLSQFAEWTDETLTARYEAIVVSTQNPDRLYTADVSYRDNVIYRSDDGGFHWVKTIDDSLPLIDAFSSGISARELAIDPSNPDAFIFSNDEFLMGSQDAGLTAVDLTTDRTSSGTFVGRGFSGIVATDVVFNPLVADEIVLLGFDGGNFIQSVDGLKSYRRTLRGDANEFDHTGGRRAAFSDADSNRIYLLLGQADIFRGVAISDDGGQTFEVRVGSQSGLPETGSIGEGTGILVDSQDPDLVYIVVDEVLYRSDDGARSFVAKPELGPVYELAADDEGVIFLSSTRGLLVSDDGAASASLIEGSPENLHRITLDPHTDGTVLVLSDGVEAGLHRFDGETWTHLIEAQHLQQVAVHTEEPGTYAVVSQDLPFHDVSKSTGVALSTDFGQSWLAANEGLPMLRVASVAFDPHNTDRIVVGTYGRGFYFASLRGLLGEETG